MTPELVDCDLHVGPPTAGALREHLDSPWPEIVRERGVSSLTPSWELPSTAPASLEDVRSQVLRGLGVDLAVCTCVTAVTAFHWVDLTAALCRGLNDWLCARWLDEEPGLRGSIAVPPDPEAAVAEIARAGRDGRFAQVVLPVRGEVLLGRRQWWPVYAACAEQGLAVAVHAGGNAGTPITPAGWPSHAVEDHVSMAQAFQSQLLSLLAEGVFGRFPSVRFLFLESGFSWLPAFCWRLDKNWKGLRRETPWVDRLPSELIGERVRFSLRPADLPADEALVGDLLGHLGSDGMLLFSTGGAAEPAPAWLPEAALARNALGVYPRLRGR